MSLMPAFEIGVWNAWIVMLYFPLHPLLMRLKDKDALKKLGNPADIPFNKTEKKIDTSQIVIVTLSLIYSVFLPLKLGTIWFYIGLSIYSLGLIMFTIAMVNITTTPLGELFTKGLYRYSRHPMYLTQFLILIGVGIASASWLFLLFSIVFTILLLILTIPEERFCLEKYGNAYRQYMNGTPRWIGVPK